MAYSQQKRKTENVLRYAFLNLQEETSWVSGYKLASVLRQIYVWTPAPPPTS